MQRGTVLTALVLAALAAFLGAGVASADVPCSILNFRTGPLPPSTSLQAAVNAAEPGDGLQVSGLCHGDTVVTKNLQIYGLGNQPFFLWPRKMMTNGLDGDGMPGSVLTILPGVKLSIQYLGIENGTGGPGATGWFGGGYTVGGAIDNAGSLTLYNDLIVGSTASAGGGIYNEAGASITSNGASVIKGNTATDPNSGGGGLYMQGGTGNLYEVFIQGNTAAGHGGGIYFAGGTLTNLSAFRISGNTPDNIFVP